MGDWLILFYFAVAVILAVVTAIDNQRTFYVYGPPSAIGVGFTWPIWVVAIVVILIVARIKSNRSPP